MQVTLPTKTAGEVTLPGGLKVWVQTVNALHREQARESADLFAAREARPYRKDGEGWHSAREQFEDAGTDMQCSYLADSGYLDGKYQTIAETKFPALEAPTRNENETDDAYDKRVAAYDENCGKMGTKRAKHIETAYETVKRESAELLEETRLDRCCKAVYERKRREAFSTRFILELLLRGVRDADDHRAPYFAAVEILEDLPDETRDALITAYFSLDSVAPSAVPI